jgi:hypothetical protein
MELNEGGDLSRKRLDWLSVWPDGGECGQGAVSPDEDGLARLAGELRLVAEWHVCRDRVDDRRPASFMTNWRRTGRSVRSPSCTRCKRCNRAHSSPEPEQASVFVPARAVQINGANHRRRASSRRRSVAFERGLEARPAVCAALSVAFCGKVVLALDAPPSSDENGQTPTNP